MNEYLALTIIYVLFLAGSFGIYLLMIRVKSILAFILGFVYFIGIYFYFDCLFLLHSYLRDHKIYIEFGHADLSLLLMMAFCFLNALLVIFITLFKRYKKRAEK
jgi:hypothetical protein